MSKNSQLEYAPHVHTLYRTFTIEIVSTHKAIENRSHERTQTCAQELDDER